MRMAVGSGARAAAMAALAAMPATAGASSAEWGYISSIYAASNGAILFHTSGARSGKPACQGPGLDARFALDASTTAGQAQVAVLLNAYNMRKRIVVVGKDACTIWGDTETVLYLLVAD